MPDIYDYIKELTPLEIEYVDSDDNYDCLHSHIKRVEDEYILIAPPHKGNFSVNIPDKQELNIIIKTEKGTYSALSVVQGKQLDGMSGVKISYPHNSQFTERREFIRVPLKLKLDVTKFSDSSRTTSEILHVQTINISGSGLCYISDKPLENYYDIQVKIYLEDGEEPILVNCDHIYSKKIKIHNEKSYITALTYTSINENDLSRLVKTCFKYQIGSINSKNIED